MRASNACVERQTHTLAHAPWAHNSSKRPRRVADNFSFGRSNAWLGDLRRTSAEIKFYLKAPTKRLRCALKCLKRDR